MPLRSGDYINDLVRYIESNLGSGYREDQLRFLLINQGYSRSAVEKAFRIVKQKGPVVVPQVKKAEAPKVEAVHDDLPQPKKGFFAKLFSMFSSKKKEQVPAPEQSAYDVPKSAGSNMPDKVKIDSQGNLIK
jgi:hypothetical protein